MWRWSARPTPCISPPTSTMQRKARSMRQRSTQRAGVWMRSAAGPGKAPIKAADPRRYSKRTEATAMRYVPFGRVTDYQVSPMGLGCMSMSGVYGAQDDGECIATIHRALDRGLNFLDTSHSYGEG